MTTDTPHTRVAILEDHPLFSFGLEEILKKQFSDFQFQHFNNPKAFLKQVEQEDFDLMFIDINLGEDLTGVNVVENLRSRGFSVPVVIITSMSHVGLMARLMELNVNAYLMKDFQVDELTRAVDSARTGKSYLPVQLQEKLDDYYLHSSSAQVKLTPRELDIAHHVVLGRSSREIADMLNVSLETVKSHRKNIKHKVGYENVLDLKEYLEMKG